MVKRHQDDGMGRAQETLKRVSIQIGFADFSPCSDPSS